MCGVEFRPKNGTQTACKRFAWTLALERLDSAPAVARRRGAEEAEVPCRMDVGPIVKVFDALMTAGAALGLGATGFFVMLAGSQYLSAGGSVRAVESAKSSLYNALIGFAIVIMCKVIAGLVGGALGAPSAGGSTAAGVVLWPSVWMVWLVG